MRLLQIILYFIVVICIDLTANNYSDSENKHDFVYHNSLFVSESMIVFVFYTKAPDSCQPGWQFK